MVDFLAVIGLAILAVALYLNSLDGEFVFDDTSIVEAVSDVYVRHHVPSVPV